MTSLRQLPVIEAALLAGKRVAIIRRRCIIVAEWRGDHCAVEFIDTSRDPHFVPMAPPIFYDEIREIDAATMANLIKRRPSPCS